MPEAGTAASMTEELSHHSFELEGLKAQLLATQDRLDSMKHESLSSPAKILCLAKATKQVQSVYSLYEEVSQTIIDLKPTLTDLGERLDQAAAEALQKHQQSLLKRQHWENDLAQVKKLLTAKTEEHGKLLSHFQSVSKSVIEIPAEASADTVSLLLFARKCLLIPASLGLA